MIYTLGETVLDILFKHAKPVSATPGGSMLNTAVSLGRMKVPVSFISEYAADITGAFIQDFLKDNGVNIGYVSNHSDGKTSLALAFLNEQNNASYSFYKDFPKERLNVPFPDLKKGDVLLFGSFFSLDAALRPKLLELLNLAKSKGALLMYDPNFRKPHLKDLPKVIGFINQNIQLADIIKASDEDFQNIFALEDVSSAYQLLSQFGSKILIYTQNRQGVEFRATGIAFHQAVPSIQPLSTIGAGDSFSAGFLYAYSKKSPNFEAVNQFEANDWKTLVKAGIAFATDVCLSYENYISHPFASSFSLENF
jgi:fructokinase